MRAGCTQSSPTSSPDIRITIGADVYTSQDGGRLTRAYLDEQVWGGQYVVEIDNADETLSAKDYVGSAATIHLSFIGSSGSDMSPLWVHNQQLISKEGKLLLQLNCIDAWGLLSQVNADLAMAAYNQYWQQSSELDNRTLPSGEDIPAALKTAIAANYDRTIFSILEDLVGTIGKTISLDDDDGIINARKPPIRISNPVSGMRQLLDMTKSYALWKSNGTFGIIKPDAHATVYTFNTANLIFNNLEDVAVVIPNRVTFYSLDSDGDDWINGTPAVDSDSYTALGFYVDRHYLLANFSIDGRSDTTSLTALATGALAKIQGERSQGVVGAPMHCSLELFDKIQIDDYMYDTPRTTTGYIHRLIREYDRGVYRITIQVGGLTRGYTPPGGNEPVPLADDVPPASIAPEAGITIGAYIADVAFTSVDWNTVSWGAGLVTLADGRSQSVDSGSHDMTSDGAYYFYAILGNSTLQVSQTATNAVGDDRMLVAVGSRASTTAQKAYILNPHTDDILINTDKVMDGLVTELKLASEAVTNAKIAVNAVQGAVIATGAITETKISSSAVSTPKLEAGAVTSSKIDTGAVTATKIDALAVTAAKIAANAVTADKIYAGAVTAVKIDVSTLSAISANCGTLTAGTINGVTAYFGGGNVICDVNGIIIKGERLWIKNTSNNLLGSLAGESNYIYLQSKSGYELRLGSYNRDIKFSILNSTTYGLEMSTCNFMDLPQRTSAPSGSEGRMVYNPTTGNLNIYSPGNGNWWHVNRDAGWA